jgi:hypothetical protein
MKNVIGTIVILSIIGAIVILIPGPKVHAAPAPAGASSAGFVKGVWHGATLLFNFVRSLVYPDATTFETYNTGKGYSIGYSIGIILMALFTAFMVFGYFLGSMFNL